jgi:CHAT domain-containing protein
MVLGRKDPPRWIDLGSAAVIDAGCDALMRCLRNDRQGVAAYEAVAAALYRQVVDPLEESIRDAGQLLIAPDGHLSTLPFGLLIDGAGRRLSTQKIVSYLNSGRELLAIQAFKGTGSGITVAADPDFDTRSQPLNRLIPKDRLVRARLSPLPGAREEATAIDALFEKVDCLVGAEASCSAVMALNSPAVLHFATHGIFAEFDDPDPVWKNNILPVGDRLMMISQSGPDRLANPMFSSGLALSGANRRDADGNKGVLTAQEITAMNLGGTQLVVLSACETGLGTAGHGEEFMGLRRALAIAGAATQVTSLWRVDDAATRTLMTHYYRALAQGADRVAALTGAQAAVENDPQHPRWRHPCYWGAFITSGDWRPLDGMALRSKG